MRALVTGATGFVGEELLKHLPGAVVLTRNPDKHREKLAGFEVHAWDAKSEPPAAALDGVETVFHLAGDSIGEGRWNDEKKRRIRESRSLSTRLLAQALARLTPKPRAFVSASAVGYYGSRGDEILTEESSPGDDFLAQVCVDWEKSAEPARAAGVRVVHPRIGMVLGAGGGAMKQLLPIFKFGLGGRLGSGRQWMAWIHVVDLVRMMLFAVEREDMLGPINAVGPTPVTNREFTKVLARALRRPAILPAPEFGLRVGIGEFAEVLLASQRVKPVVAENAGFTYEHSTIESAIRSAVGKPNHQAPKAAV